MQDGHRDVETELFVGKLIKTSLLLEMWATTWILDRVSSGDLCKAWAVMIVA
jgi:hypothetical protein